MFKRLVLAFFITLSLAISVCGQTPSTSTNPQQVTDLFCFWASATGHGGPELSPEIMERLSSLRLKIGFDIYC